MVHHHDSRVLPPCVHVECSIDGVAVEAALHQVGYGDVCRHWHTTFPVVEDRGRVMEKGVGAEEEQVGAIGP